MPKLTEDMCKKLIELDVAAVLIGYGVDRAEARRIGKITANETGKNSKLRGMR